MFDLIIKDGIIIDGTGKKRYNADIGIKKNIIYKIDKNKAYKFQRGDVVSFSNQTTKKGAEILLQ